MSGRRPANYPGDPESQTIATRDADADKDTRQAWFDWAYCLYMYDGAKAEAAKARFLAAIERQHASGRALVRHFVPHQG